MKLLSRCQLGLQSSECLTAAGGSASKMAHSHNYGLEASVPRHLEIKGQPWQLTSHRGSYQERDQGECCNAIYDQVSEATNCHFCHILIFRSELLSSVHTNRRGIMLQLLKEELSRICGHILKSSGALSARVYYPFA